MSDLVLSGLTAKEIALIDRIAEQEAGALGVAAPSTSEFAAALLKSHLTLIRDCPGILPNGGRVGTRFKGAGGVSLGGGINGRL